ncbi:MAG: hypothetical protein JW774_00410 [Candidatus Aureabacteria bacterium]|nr:hypothetical protein [Candidatus Auribacterota bacterium]
MLPVIPVFFLLFFLLPLEAAKVTRVINRPVNKSFNRSIMKGDPGTEDSITKVKTTEQIEAVLKQIEAQDIRQYRYLKSIQTKYFDKFLEYLNKWVNELSPEKMAERKQDIQQRQKDLQLAMRKAVESYTGEPDETKRQEYKKKIKKIMDELFSVELEWDEIMVLLKKKEAAYLETQLENKRKDKSSFIDKTCGRFYLKAEDFK